MCSSDLDIRSSSVLATPSIDLAKSVFKSLFIPLNSLLANASKSDNAVLILPSTRSYIMPVS